MYYTGDNVMHNGSVPSHCLNSKSTLISLSPITQQLKLQKACAAVEGMQSKDNLDGYMQIGIGLPRCRRSLCLQYFNNTATWISIAP